MSRTRQSEHEPRQKPLPRKQRVQNLLREQLLMRSRPDCPLPEAPTYKPMG